MRVLVAGAPGAGKGTQAARLAYELGVPHIASGDLVRESMASGTAAGVAVRKAVARGDLVPDDVIVDILRSTLLLAASRGGYVLDGFPRTLKQVEAMQGMLETNGLLVELVVQLHVPEAALTQRLLARGREDDSATVIEHRLAVYRSQTVPMLDAYARAEGRPHRRDRPRGRRERRDHQEHAGTAPAPAAGVVRSSVQAGRDRRADSAASVTSGRMAAAFGRSPL
ncbi:MAG: nucleoside monophosphate kinase [Mycobacteriales bacterium]